MPGRLVGRSAGGDRRGRELRAQGARELPVQPDEHLADERQRIEPDLVALDVGVGGLAAQQGDDAVVRDAVDLYPQIVGFRRAQDLVGALGDEVVHGAGDGPGEELRLGRQGFRSALLQVGGGDHLAGDVVAEGPDRLGVLAQGCDQLDVAVAVEHAVVRPPGDTRDHDGEAAEDDEHTDEDVAGAADLAHDHDVGRGRRVRRGVPFRSAGALAVL